MQQGAVLAMLAKEPAHGYQLRARLREALGPVGEGMNDGQIYVTLTRLEKARRAAARLRMAGRGELAQARPGRVPPQADRGRGGRPGRPDHDHRHPASRAAAPAPPRAARGPGRAGPLPGCAAPGGHRPAPPGRPALARSMRTELDSPDGEAWVMNNIDTDTDTCVLRTRGLC